MKVTTSEQDDVVNAFCRQQSALPRAAVNRGLVDLYDAILDRLFDDARRYLGEKPRLPLGVNSVTN